MSNLQVIYRYSTKLGGITRTKAYKTNNGIKDTYQEHFIEKLNGFIRNLHGNVEEKISKLEDFVKILPPNLVNPILRIPGD